MSILNPWTPLHAQLHRTLRQRQLLPRGGRLLLAVSGGQDSLCLLKLLIDLQPKWDWDLAVAHCDHRWQYDTGIAAHVQQIVASWQIPFYLETATEVSESEGAARQWRYQALSAISCREKYQYVVTAHTQSDRAETLLYNLFRGTGADGLGAIAWQRELVPGVQLVRPLLEISRSTTGQFCRDFQLPVWEDVYNQDFKYARNRIRQELLPYLQTHFNPQVDRNLAQTAELLRADVDYLEQQASQLLAAISSPEPPAGLNRRLLSAAPLAIQRRAVRQFLKLHLAQAPNFAQIEKFLALINAPQNSRSDPFSGKVTAQVQGDWIVLPEITKD